MTTSNIKNTAFLAKSYRGTWNKGTQYFRCEFINCDFTQSLWTDTTFLQCTFVGCKGEITTDSSTVLANCNLGGLPVVKFGEN